MNFWHLFSYFVSIIMLLLTLEKNFNVLRYLSKLSQTPYSYPRFLPHQPISSQTLPNSPTPPKATSPTSVNPPFLAVIKQHLPEKRWLAAPDKTVFLPLTPPPSPPALSLSLPLSLPPPTHHPSHLSLNSRPFSCTLLLCVSITH